MGPITPQRPRKIKIELHNMPCKMYYHEYGGYCVKTHGCVRLEQIQTFRRKCHINLKFYITFALENTGIQKL